MPCNICCGLVIVNHWRESSSKFCKEVAGRDLQTSSELGCTGCRLIYDAVKFCSGYTLEPSLFDIVLFLVHPCRIEIRSKNGLHRMLHPYTIHPTPYTAIQRRQLLELKPPSQEFAIDRVRRWLHTCLTKHEQCKTRTRDKTLLPTRVLDVGNSHSSPRLHVSSGASGLYAALSHRWGSSTFTTTTENFNDHSLSIPMEHFPATFREAVELVRALGLQYLWIDSICIVQDDSRDWEREASRMADVYSNAQINLVADWATDSRRGLFSKTPISGQSFTHRDDVGQEHDIFVTDQCFESKNRSVLDDRGWVLQETVLPTRYVRFGNAELVWKCLERHSCQCGYPVNQAGKLNPEDHFRQILRRTSPGGEHLSVTAGDWHDIVESYTKRQVTFKTDRLPAIEGIANRTGLSYYIAGMWRNWLIESLLWYVIPFNGPSEDLPPNYAPSWSWASVTLPVKFAECKHRVPIWEIGAIRSAALWGDRQRPYMHTSIELRTSSFPAQIESEDEVFLILGYGDKRKRKECKVILDRSRDQGTWQEADILIIPSDTSAGQEWTHGIAVMGLPREQQVTGYTRIGFAWLRNRDLRDHKWGKKHSVVIF
ncbi:heterokaryon incompatibility protein-domain-containing protein [Lophiotrema nucula]|uniref:Heterokaryon incompatibility protein-domain-containing protein n=1 Tax=Lophiotrema nucula TaxID=690887 RepID=A0A6A5Z6R7_9PLEO|nr:heterokaryon incompatibility protein-domain-containing protein [Lophiotrema nucula]